MGRLDSLLWLLLYTAGVSANDVGRYLKAGDAAFASSEFSQAVKAYTAAIDLDSRSAVLYTKRAAAYISLRQQAQALRDLDNALELDDSYVQGYLSRGKLHRQMCNVAAAQRDFNKVLEMKPQHKTANKELEVVAAVQAALQQVEQAYATGNKQAAKSALAAIYTDAQDCVQAQLLEAQLWMNDQDYEQVVAATGRLLKSAPGHLEALVLRGNAYFYLNEHELAKRHYGEALNRDPDYKAARTQFKRVKEFDGKRQAAERAAQAGDWAEAANLYTEALHLDPQHRRANLGLWEGLATARARLGQHQEVLQACDAVLQLNPGSLEAVENRVRALLGLERWQDAFNAARDALQANRQHRPFHGLYQEAEKRLKMSQRKDYYKILGLTPDASEPEIKRAYRTLAKQLHPDKVAESEKKASEDKFREVVEAYEVLSDDEKRARYDAGEDVEVPQHEGGFHHPFQHFTQGGQTYTFHFG